MATDKNFNPEEDETFWEKYRVMLIVGVLFLALAGYVASKVIGKKSSPTPQAEKFTMVTLPPPPPRPTPPPPTPPPQVTPPPVDQKMEEQVPVEQDKPPEKPSEPKADEPPIGTNNVGDGPADGFGLGPGNGNGFGGPGKGGNGGGSKFGWYAAKVQSRIQDALQKNRRTRSASLRVEVRIWPDLTGRVTRAELKTSTGDSSLDEIIRSEVLTGLQLTEPPPADMKLPIVLRLTARRPS